MHNWIFSLPTKVINLYEFALFIAKIVPKIPKYQKK